MERWYLLITEKFFFWSFRKWEIRSFLEPKSWWKDDIYWLLRSSCFEFFSDGKYGFFFSQKVDGKMKFTWSFWAFYDILGPGKYGFSRSVRCAFSSFFVMFVSCFTYFINKPFFFTFKLLFNSWLVSWVFLLE